jgi:EmrB/QacA subfamily drug resistance transporter
MVAHYLSRNRQRAPVRVKIVAVRSRIACCERENLMSDLANASAVLDRPVARGQAVSWAPLLVILAGTFVTFLDFFIVNVALPSIASELHADTSAVSLVVAGYALSFAVGMIPGGRLGDRYGRRRMFTLGLALFTLTSALCGLAPTVGVLVAARVLQGAAGALITPQVLALIGAVYSGEARTKAFAGYGFAMGIAAVLGQLLGGALIHADLLGSGWRAIFLINVPVGLIALPLVRRTVPESRGSQSRLDLGGAGLVTVTVAAVVLPLVEGREHGWPLWTWLTLAASPLLAGAFVAHQRGRAMPLVPLSLFRVRSFGVGSLTAFTFALVPAAFFFVLALYLQQGRGYGALFSGVVFTAVGVGYFAALRFAAPIAARLQHQVLAAGAVLVAAGCLLLAAEAGAASSVDLVPGLALVGFGIGLVLVPLSATVLAGVDPQQAGSAAGVLSTAQQVGAALGIAVIGVVFFGAGTVEGAFRTSLEVLAGLTLLTAVLTQALAPRPSR